MAVGFYCETIYHLFVALSMATAEFREDKKILFIGPTFKDSRLIIQSLKKSPVFSHVYVLNTHVYDRWIKWNHRFRYIYFYKSVKKASILYSLKYFILLTCDPPMVASFEKIVHKYNPDCKVAIGEDGLGTYVHQSLYGVSSFKARWMFSLCGLYKHLFAVKDMYVYDPDLVQNERGYHLLCLQKPSLENRNFVEAVHQIFSVEKLPSSDFLILHQPFRSDYKEQHNFDMVQQRMLSLLVQLRPHDKLAMKLHPRTREKNEFPKEIHCFKSTTPFEVALDPSIEKTTLVTLFSTAVFTPFLIWGYTPPLILLYKLANKSHLTDNLESFVQQFRVLYEKAGGRIAVPETWDELRDVLLREGK